MNKPLAAKAKGWTRRKHARPGEILDAALALFAEKGFAATRMDDIARRAGVTKGTIYLYFENKDAVFKALLAESVSQRIREVEVLVERFEGPTHELLATALRGIGDFVAHSDRVVLPKIVIAEAGNFPELARYYRKEIIDRGIKLWAGILSRGIARGEFRAVPLEHAARICVAPVLLAAIWRTTMSSFDTKPYDYAGLIETHLDILLRGIAPEGTQS